VRVRVECVRVEGRDLRRELLGWVVKKLIDISHLRVCKKRGDFRFANNGKDELGKLQGRPSYRERESEVIERKERKKREEREEREEKKENKSLTYTIHKQTHSQAQTPSNLDHQQ
jgi:hypothetical protein